MKIGIFGGTFNPIHNGHLHLIEQAFQLLKLDKIFVVPTFISAFKVKEKFVNPTHRVNMIKLVLPEKCEISDFEIKRKNISYTIDTIRYFKKKFPQDELFFLGGDDLLEKFHTWENASEILELSKLAIFKRNKENIHDIKNFKKRFKNQFNRFIFFENEVKTISSSNIRKGFGLDNLPDEVRKYIGENFLYAHEIVQNSTSSLRAKHMFQTAKYAKMLALKNNFSSKKAYFAGLFHDIAKEWTEEKSREFITKYGKVDGFNKKEIPYGFLHQICGSLWLKHVYKCNDEEIIKAISIHTTLDSKINTLDKILYIADKVSIGRKFPGIQKLREIANNDIDLGLKEILKASYKHEIKKGTNINEKEKKIIEMLLSY